MKLFTNISQIKFYLKLTPKSFHVPFIFPRYNLGDLPCNNSNNMVLDPRLSALFTDDDQLFGIDRPSEELRSWLLANGQDLGILAIVGFGGLGKTTLASTIYRKIQDPCSRAFISVSQRPDTRKVLADCALQLFGHELNDDLYLWDGTKIITRIREYLSNRRYECIYAFFVLYSQKASLMVSISNYFITAA